MSNDSSTEYDLKQYGGCIVNTVATDIFSVNQKASEEYTSGKKLRQNLKPKKKVTKARSAVL